MKTLVVQFTRNKSKEVTVQRVDATTMRVTVDGQEHHVTVTSLSPRSFFLDDGFSRQTYSSHFDGDHLQLAFAGGSRRLDVIDHARMVALRQGGAGFSGVQSIAPTMPGLVVKVLVKEGDRVVEGQPVLVVEAMKMENVFKAEGAGIVTKVNVAPKQNVEAGMELIRIEEEKAE